MRPIAPLLLLAALAACSGSVTDAAPELEQAAVAAQCSQPAPLNGTPHPHTAGTYIVVFQDGTSVPPATARLAEKYGFQPRHVYEHALLGFSAALTDQAVAGIRCEPEVKHVSHNGVLRIAG